RARQRSGEHVVRRERRRARRPLAAPARELPRLGLHARLGGRGAPCARPRAAGGGARGTALHLGIARRRLQAGRRPAPAEPLLPPVKLRGLYAVTPEGGEIERKVRLALEGGIALLQYRNKTKNEGQARAIV